MSVSEEYDELHLSMERVSLRVEEVLAERDDLLAACKAALAACEQSFMTDPDGDFGIRDLLRAAIEKAEGGAK